MFKRIFYAFMLIQLTFTSLLLAADPLILIQMNQISDKNILEKLNLSVTVKNKEFLIGTISDTGLLNKNNINYQLLSRDWENEQVWLVSKIKDMDFSYPFAQEDILYQKNNFVIIKKNNPDYFNFAKYNLKIVQLEKTGQVYKNLKTSYHNDINNTRSYDQNVINAINADSIAYFIQQLQNFGTRYAMHPNRFQVANWIKSQFIRLGFTDVIVDSFYHNQYQTWQTNVVAVMPGSEITDQYVIIGGHHDSILNSSVEECMTFAPGADDNASGCAAVLETARVMKLLNYQPKTSIRFCTYAMEEFGLWGGKWDAYQASLNNMYIRAQINNDMIANQLTPNWGAHLQTYDGAEFLGVLAQQILGQLQGVIGYQDNNNTSGSDSWAYWAFGYPSIFLAEAEFSQVYHSQQDLIGILNMPYARKMVQLAAAMTMHMSSIPSQPEDYAIFDTGTGTSLAAHWSPITDNGSVNYELQVKNLSTQQSQTYTTNLNQFEIPGLTENQEYEISLKAIINNESSITQTRLASPQVVPRAVTDFSLMPTPTGISLSWSPNIELDITGYKIYRKLSENGTPQLYQTIAPGNINFMDLAVESGQWYYYYISAIDGQQNESTMSICLAGRKVSLDHGTLVIDDTYNGNGNLLSPTDLMVDSFYNTLLDDFANSDYEITNDIPMTLSELAPYSTVIFHRNTTNISTVTPYLDIFSHYLSFGGKMIISAYKPSQMFDQALGYPVTFTQGRFAYDYLKIASSLINTSARFKQALPQDNNYPLICVDTTKTHPNLQYKLNNVEAIYPNPHATSLYLYDSGVENNLPAGSMNNYPVAVMYNGTDFKTMTMSFPLYFMNTAQATSLIRTALLSFGEPLANEDPTVTPPLKEAFLIGNYPNPFNPETTIHYHLSVPKKVQIAIFNIKGQKIATIDKGLETIGNHTVVWNGRDDQNQSVSSGVYFYSMVQDGKVVDTRKMLLMK